MVVNGLKTKKEFNGDGNCHSRTIIEFFSTPLGCAPLLGRVSMPFHILAKEIFGEKKV